MTENSGPPNSSVGGTTIAASRPAEAQPEAKSKAKSSPPKLAILIISSVSPGPRRPRRLWSGR